MTHKMTYKRHIKWSNLTEARFAKYICNHENNVPFRLSPQWLCGNSWTLHHVPECIRWRAYCFHDCIYMLLFVLWDLSTLSVVDYLWPLILAPEMCNRASCAQMHELPQSQCHDNREGTLFSWSHNCIYIYIYIHT